MTLITWAEGLKGIGRHVRRLEASLVSARFKERVVHLWFLFEEYFGPKLAKSVSHYSVMPTYAPFIPYAWLGETRLDYKPQSSEEYWTPTFALFSEAHRWGAFDSYNLLRSPSWFNISLGLVEDKHLVIDSITRPYRSMTMAKLLPQLLL